MRDAANVSWGCPYPATCAIRGDAAPDRPLCLRCLEGRPDEQCFGLTFEGGARRVVDVAGLVAVDVSRQVRAITTYLYGAQGGYGEKVSFNSLSEL